MASFSLPSPGNRELTPPFPTPTTCVFLPAAAGSFRAGKLKLPRPVLGLRLVAGVLRRQAESLRGTKRAEIQPPTSSVAAPNTGLLGTTTRNLTSCPLAVLKHCICHFLVIIMPLPKAHNPRSLSMVWVGRDLEDDPVPPHHHPAPAGAGRVVTSTTTTHTNFPAPCLPISSFTSEMKAALIPTCSYSFCPIWIYFFMAS